jgi:hypothetical protein
LVLAASPSWLGSPQHFFVGALAALIVYVLVAWRSDLPEWATFVIAVGAVCTAELVVEILEYPVLYGDDARPSAYYDTVADMAASVVGAVVGAVIAVPLTRRFVGTAAET